MRKIPVLGALLLTACVTINIYFPAAAAEKAADEIIKDIQGITPQKTEPKPKASLTDWQMTAFRWLDNAINVVISPAQAEEADLTIDSPKSGNCARRWKAVLLHYDPFMRPVLSAFRRTVC